MSATARVAAVGLVGLVAFGAIVIFLFGEDLFGSDPGTIDSYNANVLASCPLPDSSVITEVYIVSGVAPATGGFPLRSRVEVYASPLGAQELLDFFGGTSIGSWGRVAPHRECKFGKRPGVLVFDGEITGLPDVVEIQTLSAPPADTQSFFALSLGQRETEGVLE